MLTISKSDILKLGTALVWDEERFDTDTGFVVPKVLEGITEMLLKEALYLFGDDCVIHTLEHDRANGNVIFWTTLCQGQISLLMLSKQKAYEEIVIEVLPEVDEPEDGRWNYFGEAE